LGCRGACCARGGIQARPGAATDFAAQAENIRSEAKAVADDFDLEDVYNTERHLLYVACTRARDYLLVTGVEPGSDFLDDLTG
jgi:ATP-dependent exoDNAse (exonuclease V) beta subunit